MKSSSEYFLTNLTINTDLISQPYQFLETFFHDYHLPETKKMLGRILSATHMTGNKKTGYTKGLLYFYERLVMLMEVCWIINEMDNREKGANIHVETVDQTNLMNFSLYIRKTHEFLAWENFPRDVTAKEYLKPYKALRKFFKYQPLAKWKENLSTLIHNALSPYPSPISSHDFNFYLEPLMIKKLLDACHLIYVREIDPSHKIKNTSHATTEEA